MHACANQVNAFLDGLLHRGVVQWTQLDDGNHCCDSSSQIYSHHRFIVSVITNLLSSQIYRECYHRFTVITDILSSQMFSSLIYCHHGFIAISCHHRFTVITDFPIIDLLSFKDFLTSKIFCITSLLLSPIYCHHRFPVIASQIHCHYRFTVITDLLSSDLHHQMFHVHRNNLILRTVHHSFNQMLQMRSSHFIGKVAAVLASRSFLSY